MDLIRKIRETDEEIEIISTLNYTPVEILTYSTKDIGKETDIWSFGIIIHVIIFEKFLIRGDNEDEVYNQIKKLKSTKNEYLEAMRTKY